MERKAWGVKCQVWGVGGSCGSWVWGPGSVCGALGLGCGLGCWAGATPEPMAGAPGDLTAFRRRAWALSPEWPERRGEALSRGPRPTCAVLAWVAGLGSFTELGEETRSGCDPLPTFTQRPPHCLPQARKTQTEPAAPGPRRPGEPCPRPTGGAATPGPGTPGLRAPTGVAGEQLCQQVSTRLSQCLKYRPHHAGQRHAEARSGRRPHKTRQRSHQTQRRERRRATALRPRGSGGRRTVGFPPEGRRPAPSGGVRAVQRACRR